MAFLTPAPVPFARAPRALSISLSPTTLTMIRAPPQRPLTAVPVVASPQTTTVPPASSGSSTLTREHVVVPLPEVVPDIIPDGIADTPPVVKQKKAVQRGKNKDKPCRRSKMGAMAAASPTAGVVEAIPTVRGREYYYRDLRKVGPQKSQRKKRDENKDKSKGKKMFGEDSVRKYLHEIGEIKLLDAESEVSLARDIAKLVKLENISARIKENTGTEPSPMEWANAAGMDRETFSDVLRRGLRAKEHMVAANLRLVVSVAKKYLNRGLSFQDLIQEGSIGLIRGAEKFDGNKGYKFSTYATWWIRQSITRAIADYSRPIRLPVHVHDNITMIRKTTKILYDELGRPPVEREIADRMGISVEKLRFLSKSGRSIISLETPVSRDSSEGGATLGSFIMYDGETPEETTTKSMLREDLENVLSTLSPRERDVVRMRYGFDDGRMKTLEEIGSLFEVTRERIRQIEAKALRKLRHPNRNAVLREYVYEEQ